jgi:hypothetical protein
MRTLLCAIPALLALAGTALAEPQQLDEAQLGGITAGEVAGFNLSTNQSNITSTATSTTNTFERAVNQSLGGMSTNNTYATGLMNSSNVTATGSAVTNVIGNIAVP